MKGNAGITRHIINVPIISLRIVPIHTIPNIGQGKEVIAHTLSVIL